MDLLANKNYDLNFQIKINIQKLKSVWYRL